MSAQFAIRHMHGDMINVFMDKYTNETYSWKLQDFNYTPNTRSNGVS